MADESTKPGFEISEDFSDAYANHVYYESSTWDLKLIFGQLDQSGKEPKVVQHTAITIPWALAKIASYWLRGIVESQELVNGKISVPNNIIPPELPGPSDEIRQNDPNADAIFGIFKRVRDNLIADLGK